MVKSLQQRHLLLLVAALYQHQSLLRGMSCKPCGGGAAVSAASSGMAAEEKRDGIGWAYVRAADIIPRRRFTTAHELGHFVLNRETMGSFRADTDETLKEADGDVTDQMEREANRFAVELLLPTDLCRARAEELLKKHGCCPRGVLVYRLASELLVSLEAMRYRLKALEVGDE